MANLSAISINKLLNSKEMSDVWLPYLWYIQLQGPPVDLHFLYKGSDHLRSQTSYTAAPY